MSSLNGEISNAPVDDFIQKLEDDALTNSKTLDETVNDGSSRHFQLPKSSLPVATKKYILEGYESVIFGCSAKKSPLKERIEETGLEDVLSVDSKEEKVKVKNVELPFRPSAEYRNFIKEHCSKANRFNGPSFKFQRKSEIPTSYNNFLKRRTEYEKAAIHDPSADITRCSDEFRLDVSIGAKGKSCPPIETVKVHIDLVNRVMGKSAIENSTGYKKIKCSQTVKFIRHRPKATVRPGLEELGSDVDMVGEKGSYS